MPSSIRVLVMAFMHVACPQFSHTDNTAQLVAAGAMESGKRYRRFSSRRSLRLSCVVRTRINPMCTAG